MMVKHEFAAVRARELLEQLSLEEKLYQLSAQMLFGVESDYEQKRNPKEGNYRNPGHFMHAKREKPASPSEVAERINRDVRLTMDAHPHAIPPHRAWRSTSRCPMGYGDLLPSAHQHGLHL